MKKTDRIYISVTNNDEHFVCFSLEDAIQIGINEFKKSFYNYNLREPINNEELEYFVKNKCNTDSFLVEVISCNRITFESIDEILSYLKYNIDIIPNDELYDFLLKMVNSEIRFYDHNGKFISNDFDIQNCGLDCYNANIEFTEESCKDRKFKFSYEYQGIDTMYSNTNIIPYKGGK